MIISKMEHYKKDKTLEKLNELSVLAFTAKEYRDILIQYFVFMKNHLRKYQTLTC